MALVDEGSTNIDGKTYLRMVDYKREPVLIDGRQLIVAADSSIADIAVEGKLITLKPQQSENGESIERQ